MFFLQFLVIKTLDPVSLEMLDPDQINPGPQHWENMVLQNTFIFRAALSLKSFIRLNYRYDTVSLGNRKKSSQVLNDDTGSLFYLFFI